MRAIVVGAGFAGACAAWMLRERFDAEVTVLEEATVPGGMLRTLHTPEGLPYEYGPRVVSVFRGASEALPFLRQFLDLHERQVYQGTRLRPEYPVIPFPVDLQSLQKLPCGEQIKREVAEAAATPAESEPQTLREYLESSLGPTLTELAFEGFNRKFWGRRLEEMPAEWGRLRRLDRIAEVGDFRLPSLAPHYYPAGGFNGLFEKMLAGFDLRTGTRVDAIDSESGNARVLAAGEPLAADVVVATAPIDALLGRRFGALEWRGYRVEVEVGDTELGRAPDGVPFAWLYTPWEETRGLPNHRLRRHPQRQPAVGPQRDLEGDRRRLGLDVPGLVGGRALLPLPAGCE